jgi:hypothetical protein
MVQHIPAKFSEKLLIFWFYSNDRALGSAAYASASDTSASGALGTGEAVVVLPAYRKTLTSV